MSHRLLAILFLFPSFIFGETHFFVVRHGETPRNAAGVEIQGWIDDEAAQLNAKGKSQADAVGRKLAELHIDLAAIYTSPLGRCQETAIRIASSFPGVAIVQEPRLKEICHGQHDTMSFQERNAFCLKRYEEMENAFKEQFPGKKPERFFKWEMNPLCEREIPSERKENPFEGELETVFQVYTRVTEAIAELATNHPGQTVLLSTHACVVKTLADEAEYRERGDESPLPVYYQPKSPSEPQSRLLPGNCAIYHFIWDQGQLRFMGTS